MRRRTVTSPEVWNAITWEEKNQNLSLSLTWAIQRFRRLDGRNDREQRDRHRDLWGVHHMPSLLGLPCARAPRPSAARHQPLTARPNLPFPPGRITLPTDRWPEICEPEGADIGKLSEWVYPGQLNVDQNDQWRRNGVLQRGCGRSGRRLHGRCRVPQHHHATQLPVALSQAEKKYMPLMLLRNLSPPDGLCNGTLQLERLCAHLSNRPPRRSTCRERWNATSDCLRCSS